MDKKISKLIYYLLPTFGHLLWIVTFFLVLSRGQQMLNADGDLFLHLNLGKFISNTGKIPLRDVFSHTMTGQPVIQHEWLSSVILALVKNLFGLKGIILLFALVVATAFWVLYKHLYQKSQTIMLSLFVVVFVIMTSFVHWIARPHMFTFFFLALWMLLLDRLSQRKYNLWWAMPAMMLVWVNMHGGFIIGFITWIIYGFGAGWDTLLNKNKKDQAFDSLFWRYYFQSGLISFLVSLINPSGIGLWRKIISHVGNQYLADFTQEFNSPNFHLTGTWPFLIYIALLVVVLGKQKKKADTGLLFNSAAWLVMGLYSGRNIPLFAIVAAPLLACGLADLVEQFADRFEFIKKFQTLENRIQTTDKTLKGFLWPVFIVFVTILGLSVGYRFDSESLGYTIDPNVFPVEAVDWLEENPQEGEMFNFFTWGGYLEYRLWPGKRVFIDSKSDFYGEDFVRQYVQVINTQEGWEDIIEQYSVDWAILPLNELAAEAMQLELGWETQYKDDTAVILRLN